jgi:hypothetical protein
MRWQRHSNSETLFLRNWLGGRRAAPSVIVSTLVLTAVMLVLAPSPQRVKAAELVEGGDVVDAPEGGRSMSASNPRVRQMLSAHPNDFVTVCVAGCGKPEVVQVLPAPRKQRSAEMVPTSAGPGGPSRQTKAISNDVICMAGCGGRAGAIVQSVPSLPPPPKPVAPEAGTNEPLDVR